MRTHHLKCHPTHFLAHIQGQKPFTIRENDRDFRAGDRIVKEEWDPQTGSYTGNTGCPQIVTYMTTHGMTPGFVCLGLREELVAPEMTQAAQDVLAERRRQAEEEGWDADHDDLHDKGEIASAAAAYAVAAVEPNAFMESAPSLWPWCPNFWKPGDRRRMLIKAGALVLAEIERLDRLDQQQVEVPRG